MNQIKQANTQFDAFYYFSLNKKSEKKSISWFSMIYIVREIQMTNLLNQQHQNIFDIKINQFGNSCINFILCKGSPALIYNVNSKHIDVSKTVKIFVLIFSVLVSSRSLYTYKI